MKIQVWLQPEQHELVVESLKFLQGRLNEGYVGSEAHRLAGSFLYRRIDEVLEIFVKANPAAPPLPTKAKGSET